MRCCEEGGRDGESRTGTSEEGTARDRDGVMERG